MEILDLLQLVRFDLVVLVAVAIEQRDVGIVGVSEAVTVRLYISGVPVVSHAQQQWWAGAAGLLDSLLDLAEGSGRAMVDRFFGGRYGLGRGVGLGGVDAEGVVDHLAYATRERRVLGRRLLRCVGRLDGLDRRGGELTLDAIPKPVEERSAKPFGDERHVLGVHEPTKSRKRQLGSV